MSREVEGLENFKRILELPIGSKFGLFVDSHIDAFRVTTYLDRTARASEDPSRVSTLVIPTYPMVRRDHTDPRRDLVFEDPATGLMRVLYEREISKDLSKVFHGSLIAQWCSQHISTMPEQLHASTLASYL